MAVAAEMVRVTLELRPVDEIVADEGTHRQVRVAKYAPMGGGFTENEACVGCVAVAVVIILPEAVA